MTRTSRLLRGGRIQPSPHVAPEWRDLLIGADGHIADLLPPGQEVGNLRINDLAGKLVVPGLVDAHQHLDKSRTVARVPNPSGDLEGAVVAFKAYASTMSHDDIVERAERTVAACSARGTVAIRSHVNVDPETECRGVAALIELRERWRDRIRLHLEPRERRRGRWHFICA